MNTELNIITKIRNKAADILNKTGKPHYGALYLGRKEWQELEEHARAEWLVNIKSHADNWVHGIPVYYVSLLAEGIYTVTERNAAIQAKKAATPDMDALL